MPFFWSDSNLRGKNSRDKKGKREPVGQPRGSPARIMFYWQAFESLRIFVTLNADALTVVVVVVVVAVSGVT